MRRFGFVASHFLLTGVVLAVVWSFRSYLFTCLLFQVLDFLG